MPTFTVTLREALDSTGASCEFVDGKMVIENSNIGLEHYPIFDENYRVTLNSHIVSEYYNREIAHETIAIFQLRLAAHMNLHMPTFNKRYELALKEFDPLVTMSILNKGTAQTTQTAKTVAESSGSSDSKSGMRSVFSDTPQTMLSGNSDYATNANDATNYAESASTSADTGSSETESGGETTSSTEGYNGAPADIIMRAQQSLLNIDLMVVQSLEPLFFGIWSNSDEFPTGGNIYAY